MTASRFVYGSHSTPDKAYTSNDFPANAEVLPTQLRELSNGKPIRALFYSCRRFIGRFSVRPRSIQVVLDTEGVTLEPGKGWELEEFQFGSGSDRNVLLTVAAEHIARHHLVCQPASP
jgi:alpha-galactosidase